MFNFPPSPLCLLVTAYPSPRAPEEAPGSRKLFNNFIEEDFFSQEVSEYNYAKEKPLHLALGYPTLSLICKSRKHFESRCRFRRSNRGNSCRRNITMLQDGSVTGCSRRAEPRRCLAGLMPTVRQGSAGHVFTWRKLN